MDDQAVRSKMNLGSVQTSAVYQRLNKKLQKKSSRRRIVRYGIFGVNALLLAVILGFVLLGNRSAQPGSSKALAAAKDTSSEDQANPLDLVSSADIAVNIARVDGLPETTAIVNQADSVNMEMALPPAAGTSIVAKPQVVATSLKSRKDIRTYTTVPGDTVTSVANKFGVTSDSIRWSNNLTNNFVVSGKLLYIPPDNGIVYTVKDGDTADSLASKFKASKDEIIAANDAELSPIKPGEQILIPGGTKPAPVVTYSSYAGFGWGSAPIYGGNLYTFGYCTWYVANKVRVPNNWGNANTWDEGARASGWIVSKIPKVGAVAQSNQWPEGHVAYVEAVSADGTQIKYSDMNGLAGWGRIGYSDWTPASHFDNYIYQ